MAIYQVTTEGDCEGRSVSNLGIWEGDIVDIALGLANRCAYSLTFKEIQIKKPLKPTGTEVDITIWNSDLTNETMIITNLRNDTRVKSLRSDLSMWRGKISLASEEDIEEMRMRALMQQLSPEDVALLKKKL
jgi:hypothetical protein